MPWKSDDIKLPTNKKLAYKRLQSVWSSLSRDNDKLKSYDSIMREQLRLGFIEPVESEFSHSDKVHYIPHHGVEKKSATTPIRIVFDCSAKQSKAHYSLNDCLLTGPSLVNDLTAILLRFRLGKYGCISDIEKAFLMVELSELDRDSCRFLWPRNPFDPNSEILTYRFKVVLFGSTASQFLLNSTICHHLAKYPNETSQQILNNLYIDHVLFSSADESELVNFYKTAKAIMTQGNFNLREWATNSHLLHESLKKQDKCSDEPVRALGVNWATVTDKFTVAPYVPSTSNAITKREIVSNIAKTYDPYGFLMPITVASKLFIQDLWKIKVGWDQKIPSDKIEQWEKHVSELKNVTVQVNRGIKQYSEPALHIFADSSRRCYGAVAYFVEE